MKTAKGVPGKYMLIKQIISIRGGALLIAQGLGLIACKPESIAPLPFASPSSASASSHLVDSVTSGPGTTPSVSPSVLLSALPSPTFIPEFGPRAVYYLKRESSVGEACVSFKHVGYRKGCSG